jgi:hypothetical protein
MMIVAHLQVTDDDSGLSAGKQEKISLQMVLN